MPPLRGRASPVVAHLTTSLDIGGAQTMLAKLVEAAVGQARHPAHNVVSLMASGAIAARLHDCHCPVYDLGMKRGWPTPIALVRLLRIIGAIGPDLIQGWMYHGNIAASLAGAGRRAPVIWNIRHSLNRLSCESRSTRALLSLSARIAHRVDAIVYNSRTAAKEHQSIGFAADRAIVIPNGFNCAQFHPEASRRLDVRDLFGIRGDPLVVGAIARFHPMKDHLMLIEAVRQARSAGHDLHLLMVGAGLDQPPGALEQAVRNALPADRVTLAGERADVSHWLASLDMLALTSAWGEAFPNILGEAMACGVPCAATAVGDCEWIVGEGGIIAPPGRPDEMARALISLARCGPDQRRAIGAIGRARVVEQFALDRISNQYRRLYDEVLGGPPPARWPRPSLPAPAGGHPA